MCVCVVCVFIIEDNLSEEEASGSADILVLLPALAACTRGPCGWKLKARVEDGPGRF